MKPAPPVTSTRCIRARSYHAARSNRLEPESANPPHSSHFWPRRHELA
jgi:hypothetical protein